MKKVNSSCKWGHFLEDGKFEVTTPCTPAVWKNALFNDEYFLDLSQRACGKGCRVDRFNKITVIGEERCFFVKCNDTIYKLFSGNAEKYSAVYSLTQTVFYESYAEFDISAAVTVPGNGKREVWKFDVSAKDKTGQVKLFCLFPFGNEGGMSGSCVAFDKCTIVKHAYPYHVFYEDKEKVEKNYPYTFVKADCNFTSYDCSKELFYGFDNPYAIPTAVTRGCCSDTLSFENDLDAAMCFELNLEDGENSVTLTLGCCIETDEIVSMNYDNALKSAEAYMTANTSKSHIKTNDTILDCLFNGWLVKQLTYLTRHNRGSAYSPVRNRLQDAMGYSLFNPEFSFEILCGILQRQRCDGYLKQWYMFDDSPEKGLCKINHSDAAIWLIICACEIIENLGDKEAFNKKLPYQDSEQYESIQTHLEKAADYMLNMTGAHGLCLMLDGDWTDPVNGAGRLGRGESVWNSMALIYAVKQLITVFPNDELKNRIEELDSRINEYCWDEDRYIAGFDDNGNPYGKRDDDEANLFLNTQTWAVISNVAKDERLMTVRATIEKLKTPFGYQLLSPAFSQWNPVWGRISIKQKGTSENGSVYCHASMFKVLADISAGDFELAMESIIRILPVNGENPPEINSQIPIFVPNYYYSDKNKAFGKSSGHYSTGTVAWIIWLMVKYISGRS